MWILKLFFGWIPKALIGAWNWITSSRENALWALVGILFVCTIFYRQSAVEFRSQIAVMKETQKKATQDQINVNQAPAKKSEAIAEKSNAEAPAYYRRAADAGNSSRVRCQANPVSRPNLPGTNPVVEGVHGSDSTSELVPTPELVCRPKSEDDQLIYGTSRAAQMRQEALELIKQGVAVPYSSAPD
jgi:hypothetical protein